MNQWNKPPLGSIIDHEHPLSRGLVMALLMNEGSGNRTYDLTHNGNDGVLTNGPLWKPGRNGAAISFDGASQYAQISDSQMWDDIATHGSVYVVFNPAVVPTSGFAYPHLVARRTTSASVWNFFIQSYSGGNLRFASAARDVVLEGSVPKVGVWQDGLTTWGGNKATMYQNGSAMSTDTTAATVGTGDLGIGIGDRIGGGRSFIGQISDVRIWNRALSAQEVQDLYTNPYGCIWEPRKYWLMPQGVTIPPHLLFRRVA